MRAHRFRHHHVAGDLRVRHRGDHRLRQRPAMAVAHFGFLCGQQRGGHGIQLIARDQVGRQRRGEPALDHLRRLAARQVGGADRQPVLQGQCDQRLVVLPGPAGPRGHHPGDHAIGIRAVTHGSVQRSLLVGIELLHRDDRPPARGDVIGQPCRALGMPGGAVVDLAEQQHAWGGGGDGMHAARGCACQNDQKQCFRHHGVPGRGDWLPPDRSSNDLTSPILSASPATRVSAIAR